MQNRWRHQDLTFPPLRDSIRGPNPFAKVVLISNDARLHAGRALCQEEAGIESARGKCRRHPPADIYEGKGIDSDSDFFQQLSGCADSRILIRIELPSRKCMKGTLKDHLWCAADPEDFQVGGF